MDKESASGTERRHSPMETKTDEESTSGRLRPAPRVRALLRVTLHGLLGAVIDNETLLIVDVNSGSIAEAAGLRVGDTVVMITGANETVEGTFACTSAAALTSTQRADLHAMLRQRPINILVERVADASPLSSSVSAADDVDLIVFDQV